MTGQMAKRKTLFSPRTETGVGGVRGGTEGKDSETVGTEKGTNMLTSVKCREWGQGAVLHPLGLD